MKPTEKSSSPQDWSLQSQTSAKSLSSVLSNTVKEPSTSSVNTPEPPPAHHPDGFQVPWPINWQRSSKNQDSWSLLIQRATDKPLSKPHTSTSQQLLCATPTPHWTLLILLFHVTTEYQRPLPLFSGCWPEKWWDWEVNSPSTSHGT